MSVFSVPQSVPRTQSATTHLAPLPAQVISIRPLWLCWLTVTHSLSAPYCIHTQNIFCFSCLHAYKYDVKYARCNWPFTEEWNRMWQVLRFFCVACYGSHLAFCSRLLCPLAEPDVASLSASSVAAAVVAVLGGVALMLLTLMCYRRLVSLWPIPATECP